MRQSQISSVPAGLVEVTTVSSSRFNDRRHLGGVSVGRPTLAKAVALGFLFGVLGFSRAEAGSTFLGTAGTFNVYVSGNMTQNGGDAATSVAVGGNASMTNFTIAGVSGDSLVVGGTLGYTQAEIQKGNVRVAGVVTMGSSDNSALSTGATLYYGSSTGNTFPTYKHFTTTNVANGGIASNFFSVANATLTHDSSILATQIANGTVKFQYGTLTLTGTNTNTDYFSVSGADLKSTDSLVINAPKGATVIVNVDGTMDQFESAGMSITGTSASNVLVNFYQATSVTLSGVAFDASILAPNALLTVSNGHSDGNVMVAGINATGGFEYHDDALFDGNLHIASVPEPCSIVLIGLGALGVGGVASRHRARAARVVR